MLTASLAKAVVISVCNHALLSLSLSLSLVSAALLEFDELKKKHSEECENVSKLDNTSDGTSVCMWWQFTLVCHVKLS